MPSPISRLRIFLSRMRHSRPAKNTNCSTKNREEYGTATFDPRESRLERVTFFSEPVAADVGHCVLGICAPPLLSLSSRECFRRRCPTGLIHLHGLRFTSWILLCDRADFFGGANRVDVPPQAGGWPDCLAVLMVVLRLFHTRPTDALARSFAQGHRRQAELIPQTFYIIPLTDMLIFLGTLLFLLAFPARFILRGATSG